MNNKNIGYGIVALAIIIGCIIIGNAYKYKFKTVDTISVTGLAEQDFESDQIVWRAHYTRKALNMQEAYQLLKNDEQIVKQYLQQNGIKPEDIVVSAVSIDKQFNYKYDANGNAMGTEFTGYQLSQTVTIDSKDLASIENLSRSATNLIEQGIELNSEAPRYYYSKLSELKLSLLEAASKDAYERAKTIAESSKINLGDLKKANMGVFQIIGKNSNEDYSYGGTFNTSSKIKTASITVRTEYASH